MRNDDRSWRGDTWIRVLSRGQSSARTELARTASWRGMGWVYDFTSHEMRYVCTQAVSAGRLKWVWRLSLWLSENFPEAAGCGARSLGGKGCTSAGVIVQGASVSPLVTWVNSACMGCQDSVGVVRAKTCLSPAPPSSTHPSIRPPTHPSHVQLCKRSPSVLFAETQRGPEQWTRSVSVGAELAPASPHLGVGGAGFHLSLSL